MNYLATEKIEFRKVRDMQDHINITASYVKQNAVPMLKIGLQIASLYIILGLITMGFAFYYGFTDFMNIFEDNVSTEEADILMIGGLFFVAMILFIIASIFYIAVSYRYIFQYIHREDYNCIQLEDIKPFIWQDGKIVFTTYLWFFLIIIGGVLVFSFAAYALNIAESIGFWVFSMFALFGISIYYTVGLATIVVLRLYEKLGFWSAAKRCMYLISGYWGETFGLYCVIAIILYTISAVPSIFSNIGLNIGETVGSETTGYLIFSVFYLLSFAISFVTGIAYSIVIAFRYFSLVETKEGTNMMDKIESLGK